MALNYVTITGTFEDGSGAPLAGSVVFTPSATVYAAGVPLFTSANAISAVINSSGVLQMPSATPVSLLATDNSGLTFEGLTGFFYWTAQVTVPGGGVTFSFFLPHTPATVDLFALAHTAAGGGGAGSWIGGTPTEYVSPAVVALTDAATIAVNAALGNDFRVTLAGNRTMGVPSGVTDGQKITFQVTQDATGSRTLTWPTGSAGDFDFGASSAPTLTTTPAKVDVIAFVYNATLQRWLYLGSALGF